MFGFLNIDKPAGMSSHDVISKLRKILKIKQIGHSGTLDPMATGVLPIAVGKATRLLEYLGDSKTYVANLHFGCGSDTYDSEGNIELFSDKKVLLKDLGAAIQSFIGEITQIPPAFSAVHYNGKRLYELARQGVIPDDIPKRQVFVKNIEILKFSEGAFDNEADEKNEATLKIECAKGTYIRSIIHDLGQMLGCGAIMTGLQRTESSGFTIENALTLEDLADNAANFQNPPPLINPLEVLSYKRKQLNAQEFEKVKNGNKIKNDGFDGIVLLEQDGRLVAVGSTSAEVMEIKKVVL